MNADELYDEVQEKKIAFVISLLTSVYCFSIVKEALVARVEWKETCTWVGFSIVAAITIVLFIKIIDLKKEAKNVLKHSK
ncbi:MAG: hypothetical protein ACXVB0_07105 [Mucilaginibacter sp.]